MKEKALGFVIGLLNLILIVACVVFFLGKDKTAPVIKLESVNFVYEEDLPQELLYQGVTAFDEEDGDVTAKVVIEKVVTDREKGIAMITYGASDSSGNVGKTTRIMQMPVLTLIQFPGAGEAGVKDGVSAEANETTAEITEETTEVEETEVVEEDTNEDAEGELEESETEEAIEESEDSVNEGEGATTGGNVTVVGSSRRE